MKNFLLQERIGLESRGNANGSGVKIMHVNPASDGPVPAVDCGTMDDPGRHLHLKNVQLDSLQGRRSNFSLYTSLFSLIPLPTVLCMNISS